MKVKYKIVLEGEYDLVDEALSSCQDAYPDMTLEEAVCQAEVDNLQDDFISVIADLDGTTTVTLEVGDERQTIEEHW
jgi:hypothetical protein